MLHTWHIIEGDVHLSKWKMEKGGLIMSSFDKGIDYTFIHGHVPLIIQGLQPWPIDVPFHHRLGKVVHKIASMTNQLQLFYGLTDLYLANYLVHIGLK